MLKTEKLLNGHYKLLNGKEEVGEIWKFDGKSGFGLKLHGVYWNSNQEATQEAGLSIVRVSKKKDAIDLAEKTIKKFQKERLIGHKSSFKDWISNIESEIKLKSISSGNKDVCLIFDWDQSEHQLFVHFTPSGVFAYSKYFQTKGGDLEFENYSSGKTEDGFEFFDKFFDDNKILARETFFYNAWSNHYKNGGFEGVVLFPDNFKMEK